MPNKVVAVDLLRNHQMSLMVFLVTMLTIYGNSSKTWLGLIQLVMQDRANKVDQVDENNELPLVFVGNDYYAIDSRLRCHLNARLKFSVAGLSL